MAVSDDDVLLRIREALSITDRLTLTMLQAHLTSRIPRAVRDRVLETMRRQGEISMRHVRVRSYRGRMATVPLIVRAVQ